MSTRVVVGAVGAGVGFLIGGPQGAYYGWALGSALGNVVDPQVIKGPSIGEISQQFSQEGGPIPIPYGYTPPIAGTIIAAGDPRIVTTRSGGKGGPKVETETVYRTYAIGFAEGPVGGFYRVWRNNTKVFDLDDPLFNVVVDYGSLGTVASRNAKFLEKARFFLGTYTQNASTDLEVEYGVGTTPSYRGLVYMVIADEDVTAERGMVPSYKVQLKPLEGPIFVVVGDDGKILWSPDGISWEIQTFGTNEWKDVIYAPDLDLFCAVNSGASGNRGATSPDGIEWTTHAILSNNRAFWLLGRDVANGVTVTVTQGGAAAAAAKSVDGTTWTSSTAQSRSWQCMAFSPSLSRHVVGAVGLSSQTKFASCEANGTAWTLRGSVMTNQINGIAWSPTLAKFVAVGNRLVLSTNRGVILTSTDGTTWSAPTDDTSVLAYLCIVWAPALGKFVAGRLVSTGVYGMATSTDGTTWSASAALPDPSKYPYRIAWSESLNLFCAIVGSSGTSRVITSPDGHTWTPRTTPSDSSTWNSICAKS